jgi:hypothetical protein
MARKYLRYLTFFLFTVVVLFVLITLILPSTGRVVKETYIPVEKTIVRRELTSLANYGSWYPWIQVDPTARITPLGDSGITWQGADKGAGYGSYILTDAEEDSVLHFQLTYNTVPDITGGYILRPSEDGLGTTVIWFMNLKAGWTPWWRFYAAMMNKLTGPLMEAGLTNLKLSSEKIDSLQRLQNR